MEHRITLNSDEEVVNLLGHQDQNLRIIREGLNAKIRSRGHEIIIEGEESEARVARKLFEELLAILRGGHLIRPPEVRYSLRMILENEEVDLRGIFEEAIGVSERGRLVRPKTLGQKRYIQAIGEYDLVIAIGPAGTGKTYLAVAMACSAFLKKEVARIILTRPAVEAGEKLGFLPGDLKEKVDPYLRPLYDALFDMIGIERFQHYLSQGIIEVAPLAFMRGRTLNDAFVILDEAQNTTTEQMKMFLTRLGFDSKAVVTGDITQIDLPQGVPSGLIESQKILDGIEGIEFIYFDGSDVVRHSLVQKIIKAYDEYEKRHLTREQEPSLSP
ncbi:TPA: phosphate starvation-inducible protein PhoH [bacterium]|nr:phosphate starvation-inducible protein PhoH [bacterium]